MIFSDHVDCAAGGPEVLLFRVFVFLKFQQVPEYL